MRMLMLAAFLLSLPLIVSSQQPERKVFPYKYTQTDLANGLRLVTVPTDYPNLVALYVVVQTGSRNEIEPGKSGYAHFFEHLMFRGSKNFSAAEREQIMKRAGSSSNAYTSSDRTVYHIVFSKEDLDKIMAMEADRFLNLRYTLDQYKTESGAVQGEYDKNSTSQVRQLHEVIRATAFKKHTYSHTTMGFLKDIKDMPNQFDYSWEFYRRYYRPEYTTVVLVGDVTPEVSKALVEKYWGAWKRGDYQPDIPREPEMEGPLTAHVDWPAPTLPYVAVAFRTPAFSETLKDKAALDLLVPIAFGENSDLYQRLVLKEQKVDGLDIWFEDQVDPELFTVFARVKDQKDVDDVREQILATFKRFAGEKIPQDKLDATRSRMRYAFALGMNSSPAIADALAPYIALGRTPETLNRVYAVYDSLSPEDVRAAAARYFTERNRTVVTLSTKAGDTGKKEGGNR